MEEWTKLCISFSICSFFYFFVYALFLIIAEWLYLCLSLMWQMWESDMICFIDITMCWKQAKIMETFSIFIRGMIVIDARFPTLNVCYPLFLKVEFKISNHWAISPEYFN